RQCALADDHRVHELDRDVVRVRTRRAGQPERQQAPAGQEAHGHLVAQPRDPLGVRAEEVAVGYASIMRRSGSSASHSRHSSTPCPVFALTSMHRTPGCTVSSRARNCSTSKSTYGSRSTLFNSTSSQARNISGYLSGLSAPSVTEDTIT